MDLSDRAADSLAALRETKPLIHNITNMVVMNETANALLCIGALPVMAHALPEVEEMVAYAGALVLNIGTLTDELVDAMVLAGKKANELGVPVVLDPVGAGATKMRTAACQRLLAELDISIVRGNSAEVAILAGLRGEIKGVESMGAADDNAEVASTFAGQYGCVAAITGAVDVVADGERLYQVSNGHPLMGQVTGTGCMSTTMVAAFAAVEKDYAFAAAAALAAFGLAGEKAAVGAKGPGSFHVALYDELAALTPEALRAGARIR